MGNTISYQDEPFTLSLGTKGSIRGLQRDNKSRRYAGVPYALPPTGERRWRKPKPLPSGFSYDRPDGEPYDATRFRSICPQKAFHVGKAEGGDGDYSEDCLFVNIWTPVPKDDDDGKTKWPVMLWLHGGWFQMGDPSHEPGMDPTELISTGGLDAIVVAIGYRLNVFGFLAGEELLHDSGGEAGGNFGLWDQRLAAEWVRENISLFGGDPDNITLAGRSAGAYSVEAQMLHELRRPQDNAGGPGLYRRMFMDSNAIPAQPKSLADAQDQFTELCEHFGINPASPASGKLSSLRAKTARELVEAIKHLKHHTFRPVTDDLFIHAGMIGYLQSPAFADNFKSRGYRLLIGEVANEETLYAQYNSPDEPTVEALKMQISNYYAPDVTERALQRYQLPGSGDDVEAWKTLFGQIISDGQVRAPSRALVHHLARNGVSVRDLWRFQVAYRLSFIDETVAPARFGVAHAMDKPFWNFSICHGPTAEERVLMQDWIKILVAFVRDDRDFSPGTTVTSEMIVATPRGTVEVCRDERWEELLDIGAVFAGQQPGDMPVL
jgi:carboxylesterase type B